MNLFADVITAAEEHHLAELWLPNYWFAIIPAIIFAFLGFVTWSFRDVANRHSHRTTKGSSGAQH